MGNFLGSAHVKIDSNTILKAYLSKLAPQEKFECYISPPINGWVGIFRDQFGQIPLGESLAKQFNNDIVDVMVHDDDVFCYWYHKNGRLVDSFNSCPDYFGEAEEEADSLRGNPEIFNGLLNSSKKLVQLKQVLKQRNITQDCPDSSNQFQNMINISNKLKDLMKTPEKLIQLALNNDHSLLDKFKSLVGQIPENQISQETIVKLMERKPELLQEIMGQIITTVMKQPDLLLKSTPKNKNVKSASKLPDTQGNKYLFASMQLQDFAEIIGISNALACYEYLSEGETDNIVQWDRFIKIPE